MGVPRFYKRWLSRKRFPGLLQTERPAVVDTLSIDFNGMLHDVAQPVYAYGEGANLVREQQVAGMSDDALEAEYHAALTAKLQLVVGQVKPRVALVIAIDGVAPQAKIRQQRQRRFKAAQERMQRSGRFDSNCITTGTDFMIRLDQYLQRWLETNGSSLAPQVIYSGHRVPGEGEHKIMELYRCRWEWQRPEMVHCLYGLDADLVMLSLAAPVTNVYLVREDIENIVNIEALKRGLVQTMGRRRRTGTEVMDFLVIMTLFGNDFLPAVLSLTDMEQIDRLLDIYADLGQPLTWQSTNRETMLNWRHLADFLHAVALIEKELLERLCYRPELLSSELLKSHTHASHLRKGAPQFTVQYEPFCWAWYAYILSVPFGRQPPEDALPEDDFNLLIYFYLVGMAWMVTYYVEGSKAINAAFVYPFFHAPLLHELTAMVRRMVQEPKRMDEHRARPGQVTYGIPHLLLSVLPRTSLGLIPPIFREFVEDPACPIADLFPVSFELDYEGSKHGTAIVSTGDPRRVDAAVQRLPFTPEQRKTYLEPGKPIIIVAKK